MNVEAPGTAVLRLGDRHLDMIAGLRGVHFDRRDIVFIASALLDNDLDVGSVPGANLDRAVERRERHVRLAGHGEVLFVALDVLPQVRADHLDAARPGERCGQRSSRENPAQRERVSRTN